MEIKTKVVEGKERITVTTDKLSVVITDEPFPRFEIRTAGKMPCNGHITRKGKCFLAYQNEHMELQEV